MSNIKQECGAGLKPKWRSEKNILIKPEGKMITSQECMQLKRDLESSENEDEFEVSPMILCLMLTFLLFVIGFWIWLISRSCLFDQPEQGGKKGGTKRRLSGGSTPASKSPKVRFLDGLAHNKAPSTSRLREGSSNISPGINVTSRFYRDISYGEPNQGIFRANYSTLMELPDTSPIIVHPAAGTESGAVTETNSVSSREYFLSNNCPRATGIMDTNELDAPTSQAVAGSPINYDSMPSNFGRECPAPKRKYSIQWPKFMRRGRKSLSETQKPQ
ncbi:uncharacterized protein [Drosophila takahashii]|uniref:uncharacterized protein n=1 Tax=Drosophila takahashii TaxID=29030 RepID=UPI0038992AB9